ncbi:26S proteasome subunit RPN7-domain-containing protein [Pisolithus albus]|nr:26S proteasome subunit RPN7-domain-containing protein [Pisolithus albus]
MADDRILPIPNISLPQHLFTLVNPSLSHLHDVAWKSLLEGIKADNMAPYYRVITSSSGIDVDPTLLETMEKANEEQLKQLDERLAEAEKTEGESEISDALKERANHLTRIGDKDAAVAAQQLALEKTPGLGSRTDITSTLVRIGFFFGDNTLITENLAKAENRLACTHAVQGVATRFFVTDPTEVVEAGITMSSPSPAATIERFVPLVKDIDDEVSLCLGSPFLPLPPALQRSAAQIKPVDHEAMKCLCPGPPFLLLPPALQRSAAQIKPVDYEAMKCLCPGPPFLPLPPALQRSAAQIKPVDYEAMKCLCSDPPSLPLPPALQRSAVHGDDEAMKSSPPSPPPFLLLAVHERSVPLGKHVNDEGNMPAFRFSPPLLPFPLLPALRRSAAQIKHVDDEANV